MIRDRLAAMGALLLEVRGLSTSFTSRGQRAVVVDDVSFALQEGEILALVGESGCGKSVTAQSILGLVTEPEGRIEAGEILFEGDDLVRMSERSLRRLRGNRIAMIFQEPMTSLNPVYSVGAQIGETLRIHRGLSRRAARARSIELLDAVGIPAPASRVDDYPHQLSGGMRQRVMIAMALACQPALLIADEPTTALDVTIQAQILELLHSLRERYRMSILFITHDLGIVAEFADRVAVMYAGQVVESRSVERLFAQPLHPYTRGLLASIPSRALGAPQGTRPTRLPAIPGAVPSFLELPSGCRFSNRCTARTERGPEGERCLMQPPQLRGELFDQVRCHFSSQAPV